MRYRDDIAETTACCLAYSPLVEGVEDIQLKGIALIVCGCFGVGNLHKFVVIEVLIGDRYAVQHFGGREPSGATVSDENDSDAPCAWVIEVRPRFVKPLLDYSCQRALMAANVR